MGSFSPVTMLRAPWSWPASYSNPMPRWQPGCPAATSAPLGILPSVRAADFWTSFVSVPPFNLWCPLDCQYSSWPALLVTSNLLLCHKTLVWKTGHQACQNLLEWGKWTGGLSELKEIGVGYVEPGCGPGRPKSWPFQGPCCLLLPGHYLHTNQWCGTWAVDFGWEKQRRRNEVQDERAWLWAEVRTRANQHSQCCLNPCPSV